MENSATTKKILHSLSLVEALRNKRIGLYDLVKDQIDEVDREKKETIAKLTGQLKSLNDMVQCVDIANILCPTVASGDDVERKRISRRRAIMIKTINSLYPDYDFEVMKGRSGGRIIATYIGDASKRKAAVMFANFSEVFGLFGVKIPKRMTAELLAELLRQGTTAQTTEEKSNEPVVTLAPINYAKIAEKAKSIQALKDADAEKIAK